MSAAPSRSRAVLMGLLVACLALVGALLFVQGGVGADRAATSVSTSQPQVPAGSLEQAQTGSVAPTPDSGLPTIPESALPTEALDTLALVRAGGPFAYRQDDTTFFNREQILPRRAQGYYREYTVPTRGSPDRGARRIVAGESGDFYYTEDHYSSFRQIEESR